MRWLKSFFLPRPATAIGDSAALTEATHETAAWLAQSAIYGYIRARSGLMGPRLMQDRAFAAALERCKWEGYALAAGDILLILESILRPRLCAALPDKQALFEALLADCLKREPVPPHRAHEGWADAQAAFSLRAASALSRAPQSIEALCRPTADRLVDLAPTDETIRAADREMVTKNVAFRFIRAMETLRPRIGNETLPKALDAHARSLRVRI